MKYNSFEEMKAVYEWSIEDCKRALEEGQVGSWWEYWNEHSMECEHHVTEPKRWTLSNGVVRVALQCVACGNKNTSGIKNADYDMQNLPWLDESKQQEYRMVDVAARKEIRSFTETVYKKQQFMKSEDWFAQHTAYLRSHEWKGKRAAVFRRDGYMCQACLQNPAQQVHHLTYKHWRNEPLFDLVSVCTPCHDKITELDRASRRTNI